MCACFCGHDETALTLRDKSPASLKIKNFFGQSCQDVASSQALKSSLAGGNAGYKPVWPQHLVLVFRDYFDLVEAKVAVKDIALHR